MASQIITNQLGPDAGKELVLFFGEWAMRFLVLTLCVSTFRRITGKRQLIRYRRMLGLFCWFYATLHLFSVLTYLLGWSRDVFLEEFSERPYMALGILAWLIMVPLGLTSNHFLQKTMGRKWKVLHKSIYVIAVLASAHMIWIVRSDYGEALVYVIAVLLLFFERFANWKKRQVKKVVVTPSL